MIEETSKIEDRKPEEVQKQVANLLLEIGFSRSLKTIRTIGVVLNYFLTRICEGLYVNQTSLRRLKKEVHGNPVLYLPSHRSYADFILISYVCFTNEIEIPGIAAGMDFHGMAGMGEVLRNTGAFFMRRSFINDKLYFTTFKEYVHKLMTIYHTGVEFFVEGTRSRSCKSLPPKIGLLSMCLEPLFMGEISDVTIIPVSISYDKPLEEQLFVFELLGVPKPKESTKGMLKAFSILSQNFGSIYFDFGRPFSVKEYLKGGRLDRFRHALEPAHVQVLSKQELTTVTSLAYDVVNLQQDKIILTIFNLMCFSFNYNKLKGRTLTVDDLCKEVAFIATVFKAFGASLSLNFKNKDIKEEILHSLAIHHNVLYVQNGRVELVTSNVDFQKIDKGRMKAHKLSNKTMINSVPIYFLQLYLNPCLHWIATPAIVLLVIKKFNRPNVCKADIYTEYLQLRTLFALEFVLHPDKAQREFDSILQHLSILQVITIEPNSVSLNHLYDSLIDQLISILSPFLSCYLIGADTILTEFSQANSKYNDNQILVKVQINTEALLLQKIKHTHPYALSLDTISLLVQSLTAMGCLVKERSEKEILYRTNVQKLMEIKNLLIGFCPFMSYNYLYYEAGQEPVVAKL